MPHPRCLALALRHRLWGLLWAGLSREVGWAVPLCKGVHPEPQFALCAGWTCRPLPQSCCWARWNPTAKV